MTREGRREKRDGSDAHQKGPRGGGLSGINTLDREVVATEGVDSTVTPGKVTCRVRGFGHKESWRGKGRRV